MQGGFQETHPEDQSIEKIKNFILNAYNDRKHPSEFFKTSAFSLPTSIDQAYTRSKGNIPRFLFYYLLILGVAMVLLVFCKFAILIPFGVCLVCAYISSKRYKISEIEITPAYAAYGCIGMMIVLALVSSSIASSYLFLVSFSAMATVVILIHASLLEDTEKDNNPSNV